MPTLRAKEETLGAGATARAEKHLKDLVLERKEEDGVVTFKPAPDAQMIRPGGIAHARSRDGARDDSRVRHPANFDAFNGREFRLERG